MHISDGIIDAPVSVAFGVIAAAGVTYAATRARRDLDDRTAPMAGLVAAFIFAVQMLNFPVLPGVSGHLLGGALATILVGPWLGILCVSVVLLVQGLMFADGGLTALGLNITNMGIVTSLVAAGLVVLLVRHARPTPRSIWRAAFVIALLSVLAGASTFVLEYALGGSLSVSLATVAKLQLGYHVLIGLGEGVITAVTVASVAATRPDLVWALRRHRADAASPTAAPVAGPARRSISLPRFLLGGLLVAMLLAGVVSSFASASPDGLDSVTRKGCTFSADGQIASGSCIASKARAHGLESSPFAGYATNGVGGRASTGLSGLAGVAVTLAAAYGLSLVLRRRRDGSSGSAPDSVTSAEPVSGHLSDAGR